MKYIRTKDGIYDKIQESFILTSNPPKYELTKNGKHIGYEICSNCRLADTIEELCDELVIKYENEEKPRYIDMSKLLEACKNVGLTFREHVKWLFAYYKDRLEICKLAIRTDKGLKYVAKMNDKGELELL